MGERLHASRARGILRAVYALVVPADLKVGGSIADGWRGRPSGRRDRVDGGADLQVGAIESMEGPTFRSARSATRSGAADLQVGPISNAL
jgi:hypothetical protein